jgi:hypothetical protein
MGAHLHCHVAAGPAPRVHAPEAACSNEDAWQRRGGGEALLPGSGRVVPPPPVRNTAASGSEWCVHPLGGSHGLLCPWPLARMGQWPGPGPGAPGAQHDLLTQGDHLRRCAERAPGRRRVRQEPPAVAGPAAAARAPEPGRVRGGVACAGGMRVWFAPAQQCGASIFFHHPTQGRHSSGPFAAHPPPHQPHPTLCQLTQTTQQA